MLGCRPLTSSSSMPGSSRSSVWARRGTLVRGGGRAGGTPGGGSSRGGFVLGRFLLGVPLLPWSGGGKVPMPLSRVRVKEPQAGEGTVSQGREAAGSAPLPSSSGFLPQPRLPTWAGPLLAQQAVIPASPPPSSPRLGGICGGGGGRTGTQGQGGLQFRAAPVPTWCLAPRWHPEPGTCFSDRKGVK